ncbi:hypothetical protein HAX54_047250, partial [Datura stramonium]|nr:hypothetical protein [Datura stramonium]
VASATLVLHDSIHEASVSLVMWHDLLTMTCAGSLSSTTVGASGQGCGASPGAGLVGAECGASARPPAPASCSLDSKCSQHCPGLLPHAS